MFEWLRKLMAGDQSAVPADAQVERDEAGRVTRVSQTLTPAHLAGDAADAPAPAATNPPLAPMGDLAPRLAAASAWLVQQNIHLAWDWGVGLESQFSVDQDSGLLTLTLPGNRTITARATILGSFDPRDRSFMWGWANPSARPEMVSDAAQLRAEGERTGHAALTTPVQTVVFDNLLPLLALAAQDAGADGVYRCMVNGSTSIFLAFRINSEDGAQPLAADAGLLAETAALVTAYNAEMLPFDIAYRERKGEDGLLATLLAGKLAIYNRYWSRSDDYWQPASIGWPSDHDPARHVHRFALPHPEGGAMDVTILETVGEAVHRVEMVDGKLKITDMLLEWGNGFVWPKG